MPTSPSHLELTLLPMILAVDVTYSEKEAIAAGVAFSGWGDAAPEREFVTSIEPPAEYQPGQFYKRELPCILKLLKENDLHPDIIVIDGFVYLDGFTMPGLGKHLYDALGGDVIVIGVAKTAYKGIPEVCHILRGGSLKPLYVTAAGIHLDRAKEFIRDMHGKYRFPTLLKRVDQLCRSASYSPTSTTEAGGSDERGTAAD